ncbi:GTPase domain-containing protein [Dyadobacter bucti]|uniref:GTPase domain-containing protein n=1 Tax=Dyadobacter bucti TaxID=2572203 RepID=UPI001108E4BA|nr:GTPase domain-containing protein [Dyadobacter bucti]
MRNWKSWGPRFANELNGIAGVTGIGGTLMGVSGVTIFSGTALASALSGGGVFLAVGTFVYAIVKAFPVSKRKAEDLLGKHLDINELNDIYPPLKTIGFIGPKAVGKTTLKEYLKFQNLPRRRTQTITGQIIAIPEQAQQFIVVLDGAGEWNTQQFKIAEIADYICVILDHNFSHVDSALSDGRLKEITQLYDQLRRHLIQTNVSKKKWIEVLVNKRDLWQQASANDQVIFEQFYTDEFSKWRNGNFADVVTLSLHSNEIVPDLNGFMEKLKARA